VGAAIEIEAGLGADDAWLENGWKFPQFSVFANKGRCLIFGFCLTAEVWPLCVQVTRWNNKRSSMNF
jgi:hypothetical protein